MNQFLTASALAALLVVGGLYESQRVFAQDNQPCVGENCPAPDQGGGKKRMKNIDQNNQVDQNGEGEGQPADQTTRRKKRAQGSGNDNGDVDMNADVQGGSQKSMRHADWKYEPGRHRRSRSKSATFRFYFGGYWYPEPYWQVYTTRGRVSCGEGRAIVASRFNRVRVVECNGGTYTYMGRRQGDTYRILLNSRTGRIVGREMI
jgi:hypothetical protein